jgi:hypothetical protein
MGASIAASSNCTRGDFHMATALARRSNTKSKSAPPRRRAAIRRVGASIASKARGAATGAIKRAKEGTKIKAVGYALTGAVAGAVLEVKGPQLPIVNGVPPQLLIGGAVVAAGFLTKGKLAEGLLYGGLGPLCAGASSLAKKFASGGTLAGEFSGGPYGFGGQPITGLQGEFDDVV